MLRLVNLRKRFGRTLAVDGLSLSIQRGEVFGLLGPNGAGKSTTIGMSIGLIRPDEGEVSVDGAGSPTQRAVRRHLGVAPQGLALYDDLSAAENLRLFGRLYGMGSGGLRQRTDELLDLVGLSDRAGRRVKTFSGGMKRRLNLACALVHDPPLVLMDEPTAGVDPHSRNAIFELVRTLKARGRTVVYTTHYMEEAERLCDRVAVLDAGRLLALGTINELVRAHGGHSTVTIERRDGDRKIETPDPVRELAGLLDSGDVLGVRVERPNLESVFLALTGRSLRD